jgi:hypothetical protein
MSSKRHPCAPCNPDTAVAPPAHQGRLCTLRKKLASEPEQSFVRLVRGKTSSAALLNSPSAQAGHMNATKPNTSHSDAATRSTIQVRTLGAP